MQPQYTPALLERFWSKVDRSGECWLWTASRVPPYGYGQFGLVRSRPIAAHRMAWMLAGGSDPTDLFVCHVCDNPPCVRNDDVGVYVLNGVEYERRGHLWLGNELANMIDRDAKGRVTHGDDHWTHRHPERVPQGERRGTSTHPERLARGSRNPMAKLTEADVLAIRQAAAAGATQRIIAARYNVNRALISYIVRRKIWQHI